MINTFPIWIIAIDYILAILMIILCLKFISNLFLMEKSNMAFFRYITKLFEAVLIVTKKIIPGFIVQPIIPLYLAWLVFMIRLYVLPLCLGYSYLGKFAFIFERDMATQIKSVILAIALNLNYGI